MRVMRRSGATITAKGCTRTSARAASSCSIANSDLICTRTDLPTFPAARAAHGQHAGGERTPTRATGKGGGMSQDFLERVRANAGLPDEQSAEAAATAVLEQLAEHLAGPSARDLSEGLPQEYALPLRRTSETAQGGGLEEFYAGVAER